MKHSTLLGMGMLLAVATASGCNTFIGADDPDVIEEGELQDGQQDEDLDSRQDGAKEPDATCGDGIVNHFFDEDDNVVIEECDHGGNPTQGDVGCDDQCQMRCGEENEERGHENEMETADHGCYLFQRVVKDEGGEVVQSGDTFAAADDSCLGWHGDAHLAVINSEDEFIDVQNGVMHMSFPDYLATAWLGAKHDAKNDTFKWVVGDGVIKESDKHWLEGEPRDPLPPEPESEEEQEELCLTLDGGALGYAAANCKDLHFFVCELERPGTVPEPPEDGGP